MGQEVVGKELEGKSSWDSEWGRGEQRRPPGRSEPRFEAAAGWFCWQAGCRRKGEGESRVSGPGTGAGVGRGETEGSGGLGWGRFSTPVENRWNRVIWKRRNSTFTGETPGRHHLHRVAEVGISSGESRGSHHLTSEVSPPHPDPRPITRTSDRPQLRRGPQNRDQSSSQRPENEGRQRSRRRRADWCLDCLLTSFRRPSWPPCCPGLHLIPTLVMNHTYGVIVCLLFLCCLLSPFTEKPGERKTMERREHLGDSECRGLRVPH